jgi:hypothetical protein
MEGKTVIAIAHRLSSTIVARTASSCWTKAGGSSAITASPLAAGGLRGCKGTPKRRFG